MPTVVALQEANRDAGLQVLSLTGQWQEDEVEAAREQGAAMGIEHPIGYTAYFGEQTPYLNMNVNSGLTYAFVIGKGGGVRWKGNHAGDREEFLEAVSWALNTPAAEPLPEGLDPRLADAIELYVEGRFEKAGALADKLLKKLERGKDDADRAAADDARALRTAVDATAEGRWLRLERALEELDGEAFLRASWALEEGFSRDLEKRVAGLVKEAGATPEFGAELEAWEDWLELEAERPALFPVVREKDGQRYAKALTRWLGDRAEGPGITTARAWLARWEGDGASDGQ